MMCVRVNSEFLKIHFFSYIFFNKDISFNIPWIFLKFGIHVLECHLEVLVCILCNL